MPFTTPIPARSEQSKIEIIAVPGIGASCWKTWSFEPGLDNNIQFPRPSRASSITDVPGSTNPSTQAAGSQDAKVKPIFPRKQSSEQLRKDGSTVFDQMPQARVWFYDYPPGWETRSIDECGLQLLKDIGILFKNQLRRQPLHFVGHSTGGLVIKHALLAEELISTDGHASLLEQTFSVAFFGTPHYGSDILSSAAFATGVKDLLNLKLNDQVQKYLKASDEEFKDTAMSFAPIALGLRKIFTFLESKESSLKVLAANTAGEEQTSVSYMIVDTRSATLGYSEVPIGNETVFSVNSDHRNLSKFGNNPNSATLKAYIGELRTLVDEVSDVDNHRTSWRENALSEEVMAEIHLFYEIQEPQPDNVIKLFSMDKVSLGDLCHDGPTACLRRRLTKTSRRSGGDGKTFLTARRHSFVDVNVPDSPKPFATHSSVPSIAINGEIINDDNDETNSKPTIRTSYPQSQPAKASESSIQDFAHLPQPVSSRYVEYMDISRRDNLYELPTLSSQRFRWIRIPTNVMSFVPKVLRAIAEEDKKPGLLAQLMHQNSFHSHQNIERHGRSHGRYMRTFFKSLTNDRSDSLGVPTSRQAVLFFPYLHWDNFVSLIERNNLISKRSKQRRPFPVNKDILGGYRREHKLIWQYLTSSANLPLHHRRSLDQYGYSSLRDVSARDGDQVLYKRTRVDADADFDWTKRTEPKMNNTARAYSRVRGVARSRSTSTEGRFSIESRARVVMVDSLWLWIVDPRTILTFFTSRESDDDGETNHADLRDAIYNDVNGDPRLATQCRNCDEFTALIIRHAVTVFLEQKTEKDLEVFRIFEEYISILTERLTKSFKEFRNRHQTPDLSVDDLDEVHDNSHDLWCFLELRDVDDELTTMRKLFDEQVIVIKEMRLEFLKVDGSKRAIYWLDESLAKLDDYLRQTNVMLRTCREARDAFTTLLDMKQKKANVVEASMARKAADRAAQQSRAVMTFTVFTIFFLPLSFFTSLFGMNIREWGNAEDPPAHTVIVLMCSVSAAVIVLALLLAFNRPVRSLALRIWQRLVSISKGGRSHDRSKERDEWDDNPEQARLPFRWFSGRRRRKDEDVERGRSRSRYSHANGDSKDFKAPSFTKVYVDNRVKSD